jgi:hypothetical protein
MSNVSNPNFTTNNGGQEIGSASGGPMFSGPAQLVLNGQTDLSNLIKGVGGSYVKGISIESYDGVEYHAKIVVTGCGPTGAMQSVSMEFYMEGGEQVSLTLKSSSLEDHTVKCRTEGLISFSWNFA